jgi:CBS domain-containing protein
MRLGELLRALDAVQPNDLSETMKLAVQAGLPLGRALVLSGHINEDELDSALEIQALMKSGDLSLTVASKAFGLVRGGLPLSDALEKAGWDRPGGAVAYPSRLGSLLLDAKIINKPQMEEAQRTSYETGMPLGRMLVLMGIINQGFLAKALELQRMARDKKISHNQAVLELHSAKRPVVSPAAEAAAPVKPERKAIRLGELLMLSGILTESDIMNALDRGLTSEKPLGDVLLELGKVTPELLSLALELQTSVCQGVLNIHAATDALQYVAQTGEQPSKATDSGVQKLIGRAGGETVRLGELLKLSGLIEEDDIKQAIDLSSKYPSLIGKMLVVSGAIDEATLLAALRCQFLLRNGNVNLKDAVKALQYAKTNMMSLEDALEELGVVGELKKSE